MAKLVRFDPFAELNALQRQFFGDDWAAPLKGLNIPTTDVFVKDNQLNVEAHLPNFDKEDVSIQVEDQVLEISAERHEREEDKGKKYVVRESASSFYRRIALPERADADKIEAHLDEGVLRVVIPLTPLPEPKKVQIASKSSKKK